MKVKVVHVWNTAGIGGLLARYLDRHFDYDSIALGRRTHLFDGAENEKTKVFHCGAKMFVLRSLWNCRNADIIHVHGAFRVYPILRQAFPLKKFIMHWHGSKIRDKWDDLSHINEDADLVLISTPDLFEGSPEYVNYLPNPVDEELCSKALHEMKGLKTHLKSKAYHSRRFALDKAKEYADIWGLDLVVHDRDTDLLPKLAHLKRVCCYEYYIDVKREFPPKTQILKAFSLSGLEALYMGCKVIDWSGALHQKFPTFHESYQVAIELNKLYQNLWSDLDE